MGMFTDDPRPKVFCDPEIRAKQSFKDECDINQIMVKYRQSGLIGHVARNRGLFLAVDDVGSYQEAIERVRTARVFFDGLPASLREEFQNDPAKFLDFIGDPANEREIRRLGLEPVVQPAPEPAEVLPEDVTVGEHPPDEPE